MQVIEEDTIGKRPLGRPRIIYEDGVMKDIKGSGAQTQWREAAETMENWQVLYLAVWKGRSQEEETNVC